MNNTPKQNEEKIKGINDSFLSALDDFKQYYVFYNKNPEVDEYSNNFENSKNQLQSLSGEMYTITNNIQKNISNTKEEYIINYIINTELFAGILFILALMLPTRFSYGLIVIALIYIYKTGLFATFLPIIHKL